MVMDNTTIAVSTHAFKDSSIGVNLHHIRHWFSPLLATIVVIHQEQHFTHLLLSNPPLIKNHPSRSNYTQSRARFIVLKHVISSLPSSPTNQCRLLHLLWAAMVEMVEKPAAKFSHILPSRQHIKNVAVFATNYIDNFRAARIKFHPAVAATPGLSPPTAALAPDSGPLKLNVDAAVGANKNIIGVGAIVRNSLGHVVAALFMPIIETLDNTKCLAALESDPRSKTTTSLKALAKISVQLSISNAKGSLNFINNEIKKGSGSGQQEVLEQCASSYKATVESFSSALKELDDDVMSANYDIKVAGDDADLCQAELVSKKVEIPSLEDRNDQVKLFSNIGFVITNKL
uniref:Pectinesterase inhibitor domain-containing protein n=1 Tax=Cannabis sativa TaxID=3483 RepID=A0A803NGK2_CANSA